MADEREAADLAAIKERAAATREAIARGDRIVECGPFNLFQLGLAPVVCDQAGRLWRYDGIKLVLVER